jgi:hypothetical protein
MSTELQNNNEQKQYHSPNLIDYGKMSELTQTIVGDTGFDGAGTPSSYTASTMP